MAELKPMEVIMKIDFAASNGLEIVAHAEKVSELVRCKDCKHLKDNNCGYCDVWEHYISNPDYFCGSGERGLTMDKLKPCPFCGWKPTVETTGTFYKIYCDGPLCDVRPNTRFHRSKEKAINAWNRRSDNGFDHLRDATKKMDCIRREAAKRAIQNALNNGGGYGEALNAIPAADVVEVVRCKDCYAYRRDPELAEAACLDPKQYCALLRCEFWPDGFCSYGRRPDNA